MKRITKKLLEEINTKAPEVFCRINVNESGGVKRIVGPNNTYFTNGTTTRIFFGDLEEANANYPAGFIFPIHQGIELELLRKILEDLNAIERTLNP